MSIEWGGLNFSSDMSHKVLDNSLAPSSVLQSHTTFSVQVSWDVPAPIAFIVGPAQSFRLRLYAESIGPGPEPFVAELIVPAVFGLQKYDATITVPGGGTLLGEGEPTAAGPASGVYKVACVLQHLAGGVTTVSGYSDYESTLMFRTP